MRSGLKEVGLDRSLDRSVASILFQNKTCGHPDATLWAMDRRPKTNGHANSRYSAALFRIKARAYSWSTGRHSE